MLTVGSLVHELELKLAAGEEAAAEREVRWVHISELRDPTPWLSGGELLLTTGIQLQTAEQQREFVALIAERDVAGLGFGTGFDHSKVPKAVIAESKSKGVPLFEVPYEMPFIAITEAAANHLVNEHYDVLSRGIAVNERLERLVLEGGGLEEIAREIASAVGGSSVVLDGRGEQLAAGGRRLAADAIDSIREEVQARGTAAAPFVPPQPDLRGRALAHPVSPRGGDAEAWLVVVRRSGELGDFERLCVQQAAIVVALELMRERVARDTERRLSGEVLTAILSGRLDPDDVRDRVAPFGVGEQAAVLVFELPDPPAAQETLEQHLRAAEPARAGGHPPGRSPRAPLRGGRSGLGRPGRGGGWGPRRARGGPRPGSRRGEPEPPGPSASGTPSTRHAARSRRRPSPTAPLPRSPRTATSGRSRCCSRSRTARRCASTATTSWARSRTPTSATRPSCCARSRPTSSATGTGSAPRATATATVTPCATGSSGSRT